MKLSVLTIFTAWDHKKLSRTPQELWAFMFLIIIVLSCRKFVEIPPPSTEIIRENVFEDDATALAAISNIYGQLSQGSTGLNIISVFEGLYSDELTSFATANSSQTSFFLNNVTPTNGIIASTWKTSYNIIYSANLIIEGLKASSKVSSNIKDQLLGEALFIRAFCHFYLVNMFGDVPLIIISDYRINANASRTPATQVNERIIADLIAAKKLLPDSYPSNGRVRVNKGAVTALLARAYLYINDFVNAEAQATELIDKTVLYKLPIDLNSVFHKTSEEAILQLLPNGGLDTHTYEGSVFILVAAPPNNVTLRNNLVNAFEAGDLRKKNWVNHLTSSSGISTWFYAFKYKENHLNPTGMENSMVLRLAEQFLIRAEARAQQNNMFGANSCESDINMIRNRAGLNNTTALTKNQLLLAIEQERKVELFTEWGHRFFDLKRTGRLNEIMQSVKNNWLSNNILLPIPHSEILLNSNLKQNPGY